jgi:hypothetical protein
MELQFEDFALASLVDNVVKTIEPLAAKNENGWRSVAMADREAACRPDGAAAGTLEPLEQRQQVHRASAAHLESEWCCPSRIACRLIRLV